MLVRRNFDHGHVYCLVSKGTRDEIIKIGIDTERPSKPLRTASIFESRNSRLLIMEPDAENSRNLFVIDEEQRVITLLDKAVSFSESTVNESKAHTLSVEDMSRH